MFPILDTPRLALRPLKDADVPALFSIFRDSETMRYWANPAMTEMAEAESLLRDIKRHAEAETLFQWGIALREDDLVIGTCTLFRIHREHRRGELGYILHRDFWGRGFATEALTALVEHSFGTLGLHRLEADVDPRNAGSIRLVERLGFKREGHLRERYFVAGDIQDSVIYGLLAPDWASR
jgi:RimJ/RimL family protein N-acetyltransferase